MEKKTPGSYQEFIIGEPGPNLNNGRAGGIIRKSLAELAHGVFHTGMIDHTENETTG